MKICNRKSQPFGQRWNLSFVQIHFIVSHTPNIFHCSVIMLRHKHLIIFTKWIFSSKKLFVELDSTLSHFKHLFMIDILFESLSCINSHGWVSFFYLFEIVKRSSHNCIDVWRNFWSGFETEVSWFINLCPSLWFTKKFSYLLEIFSVLFVSRFFFRINIIISNCNPITWSHRVH